MSKPEIASKLDQLINLVGNLQEQVIELKEDNHQLRQDLLSHTATGWQSPLIAGRALGLTGCDTSIVKKMHRYREDGTFSRPGKHYRSTGGSTKPRYQYHIGNCDKALTRNVA